MKADEAVHHCRRCKKRIKRAESGSSEWTHEQDDASCLMAMPIAVELLVDAHAAGGCWSCGDIMAKRGILGA